MPKDPLPGEAESPPRGPLAKLIDGYNPGITLLVGVWVLGMWTRRYLADRGDLSQRAWEMLTSLIYVVPIMLVGWGALAIADRYFEFGLFGRGDE